MARNGGASTSPFEKGGPRGICLTDQFQQIPPAPFFKGGESETYDVAIIGAGVVGAAIARALSHYRLRVVLIEAAHDVGTGTSKANTAILHTGFDAKPGTVESRLVRRGYDLLRTYAGEVGIPVEPIGALLVAWDEPQRLALPAIAANAAANGYRDSRPVDVDELYRLEPHLGHHATGALAIPGEAIICPFTTPLAFATEAVANGVTLRLASPVVAIAPGDGVHRIQTRNGEIRAHFLINASGLNADTIDGWLGHGDFHVTPRRGELIVFDKLARTQVQHIVLQVPTAVTKGVLVSPTVFGNVMLGPTAEDIADRQATASTATGIASLLERGRGIMPELVNEEVTAVYVGLRAATEHADYQIRCHPAQRYVCVGGIRSTGLSASMAIAEHVVDGLRDAGLVLQRKDEIHAIRMPNIGEAFPRPYQRADLIAANPDYGRIVCHCERVTRGEILDATCAVIPAQSLDAVRRRTRALLGRCQGFFCLANVAALVARATGQSVEAVLRPDASPPRSGGD